MAPPNSSCGALPHRLRLARAGGTSHPALRDPRQSTLSGPGNVAVTWNAFIVPCGGDVCQSASTNPLQALRSWPRPRGRPRPHSPALSAFPGKVSFLSWRRARFPGLLTILPPQSSNWKGRGAEIGILGVWGESVLALCGLLTRTLGDPGLPRWLGR